MNEIPEFNRVFADNFQYQAIRSRYTGKLSTTSQLVHDAQWLKDSVDNKKVAELDAIDFEIQQELQQMSENIKECLDRKKEIEKLVDQKRVQISKLNERLMYVRKNINRYDILKTRLNQNESESTDMRGDAESKAKQYYTLCGKRAKLVNEILDLTNSLIGLYKDKVFSSYQESKLQNEKRKIETEIRETFTKNQELQESKERIDNQVRTLKEEAKKLLSDASKINDITLSSADLPTNYKTKVEMIIY